jgi:superfamily I DNA and/or RNA helicase
LPVLLRAPQRVVVGDRKQLPPFDLFSVRPNEYIENPETSDELADDSEDTDDTIEAEAESILELTELIFPMYQLRGHYRSADPKLIDFSNQLFYRGTLEMVAPARPSADWQPPIVFQRVEGGVWKKRANLPEAKAVIGVIEKLLALPQQPTIGVVTFNQGQQEAILNELYIKLGQERGGRWQEALERYENGEFVGLFVKNIENVQGDERDVIIFSMGYGPDEKGKIRAQFGSLNQQGGENRLNVAISRARRQMYVIASIEPTALPTENTKYCGPKLLRSFLIYAQAVSDNDVEKSRSAIERAVRMMRTESDTAGDMISEAGTDDPLSEQMRSYVFTESNIISADNTLGIAGFISEQMPTAISCETPQWLTKYPVRDRYIYRQRLLREKGWQPKVVWARRLLDINH